MIIFSFTVLSDFVNYGIKFAFNPSDGTKLFRIIRTTVHIMRMRPNLLGLDKINLASRIRLKFLALSTVEFKPHGTIRYNSYTA